MVNQAQKDRVTASQKASEAGQKPTSTTPAAKPAALQSRSDFLKGTLNSFTILPGYYQSAGHLPTPSQDQTAQASPVNNQSNFKAQRYQEPTNYKQSQTVKSRSDYLKGNLNSYTKEPEKTTQSKIPSEFKGKQGSTTAYAFDEGGTVTFRQKEYFTRESRNQIKDFLRSNPAESYNLFNSQNQLVKNTSGRYAYPDILKFSLAGPVNIIPITKESKNAQYVPIGIGNLFQMPAKNNNVTITPNVYGPQNKPQSQNIPRPDRTITGAASEALGLLTRPVTNLAGNIQNLITGREVKTNPTVLDNAIGAVAETLTPAAIELFGIGKATSEEKTRVTTAIPNFFSQTEKQFRGNPKGVIFPLAGEVLLNVATYGAFKIGGIALEVVKGNKILTQAAKDFRGVISPKDLGIMKVTEKISSSPAIGLAKTIGGEGLINSKVSVRYVGGNLVRVDAQTIKQNKAIFYDVKQKTAFVVEGVNPESKLPDAFNLKGALADVTKQQVAQQKKFGLTQENKDLFKTVGKANEDLIKAIKTESGLAHVGNVQTFSLEQIHQDKRLFGRFLFGKENPPVAAKTYTGLLESKGPTGSTSIPVNRVKDFIDKDVFKPFKEGSLKIGNEKFIKRNPTNTFVTSIQKNIRFQDPFTRLQKIRGISNRPARQNYGISNRPSHQNYGKSLSPILTKSKEQRDTLVKIVTQEKKNMDILFQGPRFKEATAGIIGITGITHEVGLENHNRPANLKIVNPNELKINTYGISTRKISTEKNVFATRDKVIPGIIQKPAQNLITGITPKQDQLVLTKLKTSLEITPKQTPLITPRQGQRTTPRTTTKTPQITTTITDLFNPPRPITQKLEEPLREDIFGALPGSRFRGGGGGRTESKAEFNWTGNVPETQIEGVFNRPEIVWRNASQKVKSINGKNIRKGLGRGLSMSGHGKSKVNINSKGSRLKISQSSRAVNWSGSNHTIHASKKINIGGSFKKFRI